MTLRQRTVDAVDWCAAMWWHSWAEFAIRARPLGYRVANFGYRVAHHVRGALDGDTGPCAVCDEPGGTHIDCDRPDAGRMTRTERESAFGKVETAQ
jgi:hypothetical protein